MNNENALGDTASECGPGQCSNPTAEPVGISANVPIAPPRKAGATVLDACCGGRMFWNVKDHANVLFMDQREVERGAFTNGWNPSWSVSPDVVADFRSMPFPDNSFKLIVFDPPHLVSGSMKGVINTKYGILDRQTWKQDIVAGFNECWRCLDVHGTLIFKWNDANIKASELLKEFPVDPMFGDFTGKTGLTRWITFFKTA